MSQRQYSILSRHKCCCIGGLFLSIVKSSATLSLFFSLSLTELLSFILMAMCFLLLIHNRAEHSRDHVIFPSASLPQSLKTTKLCDHRAMSPRENITNRHLGGLRQQEEQLSVLNKGPIIPAASLVISAGTCCTFLLNDRCWHPDKTSTSARVQEEKNKSRSKELVFSTKSHLYKLFFFSPSRCVRSRKNGCVWLTYLGNTWHLVTLYTLGLLMCRFMLWSVNIFSTSRVLTEVWICQEESI